MPRKKPVDEAALLKMIGEGLPPKEIMARLGLRTITQLKLAYANALINAGKVPEIVTGRSINAEAPENAVFVNQRGSLIIPKALVEMFGLQAGDAFDVTKTSAGLALYSRRRPNR